MIRVWRDEPKRGETYAGWCYSLSRDGHITTISYGYASRNEAQQAAEKAATREETYG